MGKFSLFIKSALFILISFVFLANANTEEENIYLKIKAMADGTYVPPKTEEELNKEKEDKISKEDKEIYDKTPTFPVFNNRFFCDPNASNEQFYADVMKNHNFKK
jgi:hypothetical protein